MVSQEPQKAPSLPNPYAQRGLPNPYAAATISAPPVRYTEEQARAEHLRKAAAFHNPHTIKRPQAKKPGPTVKRATMPAARSGSSGAATAGTQQHGIDYYRSTADDDAAIIEDRRQRDYDNKQKKKEKKRFTKLFGHWNPQAPHKPDRYSNLRAYRASGSYKLKKQAFNAFLRGAAARHKSSEQSDVSADSRPISASSSKAPTFAAKPSFAPPASYDNSPAAPPSVESGEDAYARRMRLSQQEPNTVPPPPPHEPPCASPPPPPPPPPPTTSAPAPSTVSKPFDRYAHATISAPPVRFERPDVRMGDADNAPEYQERPAKRAKTTKAEAMMAKMGYKKGEGLGKNSDGVVSHLEVKMRKAPQGGSAFDDEGGKVKSQQVWDVRGGMRAQKDEPGKFGEESSVVVTWGCVDGVDWEANANRNDGGIRQDMGDAFSSKFGPVAHVQLDENNKDGTVYIHFQSILSALNAVNRFDEGWEFRGRKIRAKYYDERKFHAGIYDY
ncbi:hypothetical protein BDW02DRAFT_568505 [Decorospora gaudefroyi]|uniref:G-patch domain-containing protein n=1 Tax=Decorospora gaudefroyi TaxID=184978 RepID=A0A6A5KFF5_9PLEO|nr:hypothetical protein BDW02DRAFT_568505 [Decorospora gaudefroyi]